MLRRWLLPGREPRERLASTPTLASAAVAVVGLLVVIGLLVLVYRRLSFAVPVNSDDASFVLQGAAIAHGNPLLTGWTVPADTFYTTDLFLYAAGTVAGGVSPAVVHTVGAVVYALLVVVACILARGSARGRGAWLPMLITLALLAAPAYPAGIALLLEGPYHTTTTLFILAGVLALDLARSRLQPLAVALVGILLVLAVAADPLALYVGVAAMAAVSGVRLLTRSLEAWRADAVLLVVALAAGVAGTGLRRLVSAVGGYHLLPVPASFSEPAAVPRNVELALQSSLQLFGADFFGRPVGASAGVPVLRALGFAFVIVAVVVALFRWLRSAKTDRTTQLLVAVVCIDVAAFVLSSQAVDARSVRFLVPAICAGAVLAGRLSRDVLVNQRLRAVAVVVALGYVLLLFAGLRLAPAAQPETELTAWLGARGLTYGLGSYWDAPSATVASDDRVHIRAVTASDGRLRPYHWVSDDAWYDPNRPGNDARFLVLSPTGYGQVTATTAAATFGPPAETHRVGSYTVLVWHKNLLGQLRS